MHSGSYALAVTPGASDGGQCTQTVSARPNTTYSVSAWVQGAPVYLGVTSGSCTWTSASAYSQLSLSFTTTANQTSAELYLHGWYGAGTYDADDLVLDGPGGDTPDAPGIPGAPTIGTVTDTSIALNWGAAAGTVTGYRVYEDNILRATLFRQTLRVRPSLTALRSGDQRDLAVHSAHENPFSGPRRGPLKTRTRR